jgi:hypothetical protein
MHFSFLFDRTTLDVSHAVFDVEFCAVGWRGSPVLERRALGKEMASTGIPINPIELLR